MEIRLSVCKDDGPIKSLKMHCNPFRIGRSNECDLQLNSRSVSRMHCELKLKRKGLTIKDLGSRNETIVNGMAAPVGTRVMLHENDQIQIGKYRLEIVAIHGIAVSSNKEASVAINESKTEPDAGAELLKMLEQFIDDHRHRLPTGQGVCKDETTLDRSQDHWTQLRQPAVEREDETQVDSNHGSKLSDPMLETTVTIETLNELPGDDMPVEEAEARRLELRSRLNGMKAKDSREAADRALKNLFRR